MVGRQAAGFHMTDVHEIGRERAPQVAAMTKPVSTGPRRGSKPTAARRNLGQTRPDKAVKHCDGVCFVLRQYPRKPSSIFVVSLSGLTTRVVLLVRLHLSRARAELFSHGRPA